jgi:hypothetical protein
MRERKRRCVGLEGKGLKRRRRYRRERGNQGNGRWFWEREETVEKMEPTGGSGASCWQVGSTVSWRTERERE